MNPMIIGWMLMAPFVSVVIINLVSSLTDSWSLLDKGQKITILFMVMFLIGFGLLIGGGKV